MPAQLVIMAYRGLGEAEARTLAAQGKKKTGGKSKGKRGQQTKPPEGESQLPPYYPLPVTTAIFVYGQQPRPVGDFDSVPALLKSLKTSGELGGPSNTVFATVRDINNLLSRRL